MNKCDYLLPVYRRADVKMVRGEGVYLYDDGNCEYLDFAAGIATSSLGHNHPAMVGALVAQASKLWHCSNMFRNQPLEDFAQALCDACFADKVFFCSSGTEAVEAAIKIIRRYHYVKGNNRSLIIAADGAFHGRTTGALAACSNPASKQGFAPLMNGFAHVGFNDIAAIYSLNPQEIAAIMLETIQGEGGVRPHSPAYLQAVRAWCDEHDVLLFLDEIQCGYGRTGHFMAYEMAQITPDIVTVAKGIGGGFPLAATLCTEKAASGMSVGTHGSTYGSNPLACAVGLAVFEVMNADGFLANIVEVGKLLANALQSLAVDYPQIFECARGVGLMQGLVLQPKIDKYGLAEQLREAGLLVAPAVSNVIRILPPLIITAKHVEKAMAILHDVCYDDSYF